MINSVTPWTATVQLDIENSEPLFAIKVSDYYLQVFNTGDSIWLKTQWQKGGSIAFRLAFGMNSNFESVAINEITDGLLITSTTRLGSYRTNITFSHSQETILHYTTTLQVSFPVLIPFWPRDIVPLTKNGRIENTSGTIHTHQVGARSGQLFFSMTKPELGSVFYFQNLTAMSPYCEASETSLAETVGGQWPEIGFQFPVNKEKPLPAGIEYVISDAFVVLSEVIPKNSYEVTRQFLDYLAAVYLLLPKPKTVYNDWLDIAEKTLNDLYLNKGCWTQTNGVPYLNAYVSDYMTPSEIMVQLAVKLPLVEYLEWTAGQHKLYDDLNSGLEHFFDNRVKSIVRWHPALENDLDNSEEQKKEMVMDSWYLHHPLANLGRMALKGIKSDEKLFLDSLDFAIKVAHHFNYEWPVFYKMTTLEVLKAETSPGKGGEKDVPGSYAHIMLLAWQLTNEKRYLNEAITALKSLDGLVFDIFYQANNTAFTAATLVELYNETKDEQYLELSYRCLAGIFANVQLWDCNYGFGKNFPTFFSVFPLNDAPYTAAYEELEVYAALYHYLLVSEGFEILPALKLLIPEFIRYAVGRLASYYPPMLPEDMIADEIKTGEVKKDLWVPLEDMHDGWEKSGGVGQEVYGAGIPFGIVARQYFRWTDQILLFIDYPVKGFRAGKKSVTFRTIGDPEMTCRLIIIGLPKKQAGVLKVEAKSGSIYKKIKPSGDGEFCISCGILARITLP